MFVTVPTFGSVSESLALFIVPVLAELIAVIALCPAASEFASAFAVVAVVAVVALLTHAVVSAVPMSVQLRSLFIWLAPIAMLVFVQVVALPYVSYVQLATAVALP